MTFGKTTIENACLWLDDAKQDAMGHDPDVGIFADEDLAMLLEHIGDNLEDWLSNDYQDIKNQNTQLRKLLAVAYSGVHLYSDDGELQDNRTQPFIDFYRDSIEEIKAKFEKRCCALKES